ncbi:cell division protein FtsZ [candidate division KSB1 bacterium]|nr:cell division protein FtsZ [candidate division KSB1 bacterium]
MDKKDKKISTKDSELESVLSAHRTVIRVVGCGGAGNNTLTRLSEVGVSGIESLAVNTDAQDLLYTKAVSKILIGREMTNGLGAGSNPQIGEESALESQEEIKEALEGSDMVFITCGLGGGTGTGSAPVIADLAKNIGALTIAVVTLPFSEEGILRWNNATHGLEKLRSNADTVIVIQNDRLLDIVPDLPLNAAFKIADEILVNAVKGITELVTEKGLVNLDFADVKSIMKDGDTAMIGIGESNSEDRATDAVEKAVSNPLLDVNITGAKSALINVSGDENMSMREARSIMLAIADKLDAEAKIIWGARIDDNLDGAIRVLLIATGLQSDDSKFKKGKASKDKKTTASKSEKQPEEKKKSAEKAVSPEDSKSNNEKKKQLFDIKEPKIDDSKSEEAASKSEKPDEDKPERAQKVFTEIFQEEIEADLIILNEAVKQLKSDESETAPLNNILKACGSIQSSAQLFAYDKIEEFTIFVTEVIEGILSEDVELSEELIDLFVEIPEIIDRIIKHEKNSTKKAQEFINKLTKIIDNFESSKDESNNNSRDKDGDEDAGDDDLIITEDNLKSKLGMELN